MFQLVKNLFFFCLGWLLLFIAAIVTLGACVAAVIYFIKALLGAPDEQMMSVGITALSIIWIPIGMKLLRKIYTHRWLALKYFGWIREDNQDQGLIS